MKFIVSIVFICVLIMPSHAGEIVCSEYIHLEKINSLRIQNTYLAVLTGSGTMPGTGSGTMSPCTGSGSISGSIYTQFHEPIKSVHVELQSSQDNYPLFTTTEMEGEYAFSPIETEFNYVITPSKEGDDLNGISTLDVLLLANLVFRPGQDVSPYTLIAADINQDQRLSIRDVVELVYLIIGKRETLAQSWVFVDANQQFIDEANPWPYHDEIAINNLDSVSIDNDFLGIKVGDLTGNANPWVTAVAESRHHPLVEMYVEDIYMKADETYTIDFYSDELANIKGMQLFLGHQGLEVMGIQSGILDAEKAAYHQSDHSIFMSWYGITEPESAALFSITVRAHASGLLSDMIKKNDNWLPTEAYVGEAFDIKQVDLLFSPHNSTQQTFSLDQNSPNPFNNKTDINFTITKEGVVSLHIYDDLGRLVYFKNKAAAKGKNTFTIDREELNETGVYYYSVSYKGQVLTKPMILLE